MRIMAGTMTEGVGDYGIRIGNIALNKFYDSLQLYKALPMRLSKANSDCERDEARKVRLPKEHAKQLAVYLADRI